MFHFDDVSDMDYNERIDKVREAEACFQRLAGITTALATLSQAAAFLLTAWAVVPKDEGFMNLLISLERLADARGMVLTQYIESLHHYVVLLEPESDEATSDGLLDQALAAYASGTSHFDTFEEMIRRMSKKKE